MGFIKHLSAAIEYNQLPKQQRLVTLYSEGKNYWPHLHGLVHALLDLDQYPICYVSSSEDDPGIALKHPKLHRFVIGDGFIRNWFFENLDTRIMVMTMPDLHQYQVKRSHHPVHYIYLQHSMVSLHMVYRFGAFDYFDTVFCAGPHHIQEIRALEKRYQTAPKVTVEHGYGWVDALIEQAKNRPKEAKNLSKDINKHILLAPTWGPKATIESGIGEKIIALLLANNFKVTLRPHPQTIKLSKPKIDQILEKYQRHPLFDYESHVASQETLHHSDLMISDWSGAAFDYAFALKKPVLFIDVEKKINNEHWQDIEQLPIEIALREQLGQIISPSLDNLLVAIRQAEQDHDKIDQCVAQYLFNRGNSAHIAAQYITQQLAEYG